MTRIKHLVLVLGFLLISTVSYALTPFQASGDTQTISATTSSSGITLTVQGDQYMVSNSGTVVVFIKTGLNSATAASTDIPVLPGETLVLGKPTSHQYIAGISASGSATVYVTPGNGE